MQLQELYKTLTFHWLAFLLRREYQRRLDKVVENRFVHHKLGLMTKQRKTIHEWHAREWSKLYDQYCK